MKKFFVGLACCFTSIEYTMAQQQSLESVGLETIYQIEGLNQAQIYDGARQWFATAFRSANAVIQYEDKATGSIIGKGNMKYKCSGFMDCMTVTGADRVDFTIRVDTKDGRMRVSYDNLTHYKPAQMLNGIRYAETNRPITTSYPSAKLIISELNRSSNEMVEKIKTQQEANADW